MVKKLFALASVTALTGLVAATGAAGCSSTTTETSTDSGVTDSAPKKDAPSTSSGDPDTGSDLPACFSATPVDGSQFAYTTALVKPGACTQKDIDAMAAYVKGLPDGKPDMTAWMATVSATCAACAFTDNAGAAWGPVLTKSGAFAGQNYGGCVEVASNNAACGKAWQQLNECILSVCHTCPQTDVDACETAAAAKGGPCDAEGTALATGCGSNGQAYITACDPGTGHYPFESGVKMQCVTGGSGATDGGTDAAGGG